MNDLQKKIMIAVAIGLVIAFLFPPHAFFREGGSAINMGYSFIANMPRQNSIHIFMLLAEWLGIVMIGGIFYFITRDSQSEYTPLLAESIVSDINLIDHLRKYNLGIWSLIILGYLLFYAFGASAGVHIVWFGDLFASALPSTLLWYALGALVTYKIRLTKSLKIAGFFMAWLLTAITALILAEESSTSSASLEIPTAGFIGAIVALFLISILKSESEYKKPVFIIGAIILVILVLMPDQENNNLPQALTQSNAQVQPNPNAQQSIQSSANNALSIEAIETERFNALVESYENKYKFLDADSKEYNANAVDNVNALMSDYIKDGSSKIEALTLAVEKFAPLYVNQTSNQTQKEISSLPKQTVTLSQQTYAHSLTLLNRKLIGLQDQYQLAMKNGRRRDMDDLSSQIKDLKIKMSKVSETPSKIVNTLEINDGRYGQGTISWENDRK